MQQKKLMRFRKVTIGYKIGNEKLPWLSIIKMLKHYLHIPTINSTLRSYLNICYKTIVIEHINVYELAFKNFRHWL